MPHYCQYKIYKYVTRYTNKICYTYRTASVCSFRENIDFFRGLTSPCWIPISIASLKASFQLSSQRVRLLMLTPLKDVLFKNTDIPMAKMIKVEVRTIVLRQGNTLFVHSTKTKHIMQF